MDSSKILVSVFLKLGAKSVLNVNRQMHENGINYSRKAIIQCGISLGLDGRWYEKQLKLEFQVIFSKESHFFHGQPIDPAGVVTESDYEWKFYLPLFI